MLAHICDLTLKCITAEVYPTIQKSEPAVEVKICLRLCRKSLARRNGLLIE